MCQAYPLSDLLEIIAASLKKLEADVGLSCTLSLDPAKELYDLRYDKDRPDIFCPAK